MNAVQCNAVSVTEKRSEIDARCEREMKMAGIKRMPVRKIDSILYQSEGRKARPGGDL